MAEVKIIPMALEKATWKLAATSTLANEEDQKTPIMAEVMDVYETIRDGAYYET